MAPAACACFNWSFSSDFKPEFKTEFKPEFSSAVRSRVDLVGTSEFCREGDAEIPRGFFGRRRLDLE